MFGKDTQIYQFLELVAISGEYPAEKVSLYFGEGRYGEKVITTLKKENMIKLFQKDGFKGYRLTITGKKYLLQINPERFCFYLCGKVETNLIKSEKYRQIRLHRMAVVNAMIIRSGIEIFRDKKEKLFQKEYHARNPPALPVYYSSREIKEIGMEAVKIKNARATGVLITNTRVFLIYHTGDTVMKWQKQSELRLKAVIGFYLQKNKILNGHNRVNDIAVIMIGNNMEVAYSLLISNGGSAKQLFLVDDSFNNQYFIPENFYGITLMKILCDQRITEELNQILSTDLSSDIPKGMDCDGMDQKHRPVLFAYDFNMVRITKFQLALAIRKIKGIIICFDFQKEVLQRYCNHIEIQTISYSKLERRFFSGEG